VLEALKNFFSFLEREEATPDAQSKSKSKGGLPLWVCAGDISGVGANCDNEPD
jgi:hypothetical protein